jgi:hypothetical protein
MFILGDIMLSAREALLKIEAVLDVCEGYLVNGGLELSAEQLDYIKNLINCGLDDNNA